VAFAIAGDVTVARAKELAERWFAALPSHAPPAHAAAPPVRLPQDKRLHLDERVSLERLYLVWPSAAIFKLGDAELDLVSAVLGGKSGRLYKRLVYELQVAQSVDVYQSSQMLGSEFQIVVTAKPGHTAAEMEKLVDEELAKITGAAPISDAELARAKNRWEANFVYALQPVGGGGGRADRISDYFYFLGKADGFDQDRRRYLDATVESVNRVAAEVLRSHRVALTVTPLAVAPPLPAAGHTDGKAPVSPAAVKEVH
jgi:zinc protease